TMIYNLSLHDALPIFRYIRGTQDFPVHLEDCPSAQIRLEDAFFHVIPAPPKSEKVRSRRVFPGGNSRTRRPVSGEPQKKVCEIREEQSMRVDGPTFILVRL